MSSEQSLAILDDCLHLQKIDRRNMLEMIERLPEQCEVAMSIDCNFTAPVVDKPIQVYT